MKELAKLLSDYSLPISNDAKHAQLLSYCACVSDDDIKLLVAVSLKKKISPLKNTVLQNLLYSIVKEHLGYSEWLINECVRVADSRIQALTLLLPHGCGLKNIPLSEYFFLLSRCSIIDIQRELLNMNSVEQMAFIKLTCTPRSIGISPYLLAQVLEALNKQYLAPFQAPISFPTIPEWQGALSDLSNASSYELLPEYYGKNVQIVLYDGFCTIWDESFELHSNNPLQNNTQLFCSEPLFVFATLVHQESPIAFVYNVLTKDFTTAAKISTLELQELLGNSLELQIPAAIEVSDWDKIFELLPMSEHRTIGYRLRSKGANVHTNHQFFLRNKPHTILAVLLYSNPFKEYTLAVWNQQQLTPVIKGYAGLTDTEHKFIERFVRENATERYGPVRTVPPRIVVQVEFAAIALSAKHKSGVVVSNVRLVKISHESTLEHISTLDYLKSLL